MDYLPHINNKIVKLATLLQLAKRWRLAGKKIVFTNGVFDLLHDGHIASLTHAAAQGDILVVAINNDASVKKLKGASRPVHSELTRQLVLASLCFTNAIISFADDTPADLIKLLLPDVLVKGGDYKIEDIAGSKEVLENGGQIILAPMVEGRSTTSTIDKINSFTST